MKKNFKKNILLFALATSLTVASFTFVFSIPNDYGSSFNYISSSKDAISDGDESKITAFTTKSKEQIGDDWGKYNANDISNDLIKEILIPNIDAQFYIQKNTQTDDAVTQGYVTFYVYQKITTYKNGVPTGSKEEKLTPFSGWENDSGSDSELWSTKKQSGLTGFVKAVKYSFSWNSDENIADFLKSNTKTVADLKADTKSISSILKTNFVSSSSVLPEGTTFQIDNADIANAANYGVAKVTVTFQSNSSSTTNWENGIYPGGTNNSVTRVFRGFPVSSTSNSNQVEIVTQSVNDIVNSSIDQNSLTNLGLSDYVINPSSVKLKDLLPSQIASLSELQLKQLFLGEDGSQYLTFTNSKPAIRMTYMGKDIYDNDFATATGLDKTYQNGQEINVTKNMMISSVNANPNDLDGSMTLSYIYSTYDVFTNSILENQIGSINFPAGSFRANPEAGQNLFFNFKTLDQLSFSSADTVLNNFTNNSGNTDYLKALSNSFINGSNYAYSRDRQLSIVSNGNNKITVTVTYQNFNGNVYTEGSSKQYGLSQTQTYTFSGNSANVTWKNQASVESQISNYQNLTPSELCNLISEGIISEDIFLNNASSYSVLFIPDSSNGNLVVQATDNSGNSDTQFFVGLKKLDTETTPVLDFSWISNNDIATSLLSIPIQNITVNEVITHYLSKIPYFSNQGLNASNVEITPNADGTLTVNVTLSNWNESVPNTTSSAQTFSTTLKGFVTYGVNNKNSYISPLDLTVLLSAVFASVISVTLIAILVFTILKRKKISKLSKKKFDK